MFETCSFIFPIYLLPKFIAFNRVQVSNETICNVGGSAVLVCPFVSVPNALFTWWFANNTEVTRKHDDANSHRRVKGPFTRGRIGTVDWIDRNDVFIDSPCCLYGMFRFLYLQNGSLLIVDARLSDAQRFRCVARNPLSSVRPERNFTSLLRVVEFLEHNKPPPRNHLLPSLQNNSITIRQGSSFDLVCAGQAKSDVTWRASYWSTTNGSHQLPQLVSMENVLRLDNVSVSHAGLYNCSNDDDFQVILCGN